LLRILRIARAELAWKRVTDTACCSRDLDALHDADRLQHDYSSKISKQDRHG